MAKEPQKEPRETKKTDWERFERTVDKMLHTPPQRHEPLKKRPASKGRVRKGKSRS